MACVLPITLSAAHDDEPVEIFNTYGALSSAQLLTQYGFVIDGNPYDRVTFCWEDVQAAAASVCGHPISGPVAIPAAMVGRLGEMMEESELVAMTPSSPNLPYRVEKGHVDLAAGKWYINAEGMVSFELWITLLGIVLASSDSSANWDHDLVEAVVRLQLVAEGGTHTAVASSPVTPAGVVLHKLCRIIVGICQDRRQRLTSALQRHLHAVLPRDDDRLDIELDNAEVFSRADAQDVDDQGHALAEILELHDSLTPSNPRTKLALTIVLSELSILGTCEGMWDEVLETTKV
jgi:hypothetical protein